MLQTSVNFNSLLLKFAMQKANSLLAKSPNLFHIDLRPNLAWTQIYRAKSKISPTHIPDLS